MGRCRLNAALLILATGLLGPRGEIAAQGVAYPPSGSTPAGRVIIATTQPPMNTAPVVVPLTNPPAPVASKDRPLLPLPALEAPLPAAPDDGLRTVPTLQPLPAPSKTSAAPLPATPRSTLRQANHTTAQEFSRDAESSERSADLATVPTGAQTAALSLEVVGPASVHRGQPLAYEIVVRNAGTAAADQVQVEETLQPGVRCLSTAPQGEIRGDRLLWKLGNLSGGAEKRLRVEVQPSADGEVISRAQATFSSSLHTRITQPRLTLTQSLPEDAQVGDEIALQLVVKNTSTGPLTHVLVRDQLPSGLRHPSGAHVEADVGTLQVGETKTLTLKTQAAQVGRQVNEVTVVGDDCAPVSAQATLMITQAGLAVRETSPRSALIDQEMEYRLEVASTGSGPATNVHLSDALPLGLEFVSAGDTGKYAEKTRTISWSLGTLAPGQTRPVTFRVRARLAGDYVHQGTATADRGLVAKAEGAVRIEGIAALTLSVLDRENLVEVNAETTYEVRVVNQGSGPCSNVRIVATVPDGLTPTSAQGPIAHHVSGQQVLFDPVRQLDAGSELLFRIGAKGRKPGDWRFEAQLTSDQLTRAVRKEAGTRVVDP